MTNFSEDRILNDIIKGYRDVIDQRYQLENLQQFSIPETIDDAIIAEIKGFFLNYIYPDNAKRDALNEAFKTLEANIKNPEKLLGLLKESFKLIFKHGRHLPKIMMAGLKALKSFSSATKFENALVGAAIENKMASPYTISKINTLIKTLSLKDIEQFIDSTESLFLIMYDKVLVEKIQEVISYLIERMQNKPTMFSAQEVRGLEIGLEMITKGDAVLNSLSKENQDLLIQFIIKVEKNNLNELFL